MNEELVTNNIKIPSHSLEVLRDNFSNCFDKEGKLDFEKLKQELSENTEIEFSNESYSIDWLGKSYAGVLASGKATTLLKEDEEWNGKPENRLAENLLVKGDNLEVLIHLSNAYYEQIKMIYIDPPYNTGSDGFVYQDNRKFTADELSKLAGIESKEAKRILEFTQSGSNSHSAWMTFMYPRLKIAHKMLKDDGVIFISIDDNEVTQLRMMLDEIFGEQNFVGYIAWESKTKSQNTIDSKDKLQPKVEHILLYTKRDKRRFNQIKGEEIDYPKSDEKGPYREHKLEFMSTLDVRARATMVFPIQGIDPPKDKQWKLGQQSISDIESRGNLFIRDDRVFLKKRPASSLNLPEEDTSTHKLAPFWGLFTTELGTAESAKRELSTVLDSKYHGFDTVKPTPMLKRLIFHSTSKDDTVLDFFAGSGTTGDATMQLNSEDGGSRKCILVQLPEIIDSKKNKTAYTYVKDTLNVDEPTIFEITKERLVRAGKKIVDENDNSKEPKDLSSIDLGFKVFETVPMWENFDFEAIAFDPQTKLFDESILSEDHVKILLTTWKTADGIPLTKGLKEIDLGGYLGHYFDKSLYLMSNGFETKNLGKLLKEIDSNKDFSPSKIIACGHNFQSKMLMEVAENVKHYSNKKDIDIEFLTRY